MIRVGIPVIQHASTISVAAPRDILNYAGATSFLNLGMYLIERFHSHDMAVRCAKMFLIDMDRPTQRPYTDLRARRPHADDTIRQIQHYIDANLSEELPLKRLAQMANLSPKTFMRRFKEATGAPPATYMQHMRIEAAKQCLERSAATVGEITCQVGYNDIRSFPPAQWTLQQFRETIPADHTDRLLIHDWDSTTACVTPGPTENASASASRTSAGPIPSDSRWLAL